MSVSEFDLIQRFFAPRQSQRDDVVLGIGDDCALLRPPPGMELAVSMDTLVEGVHFRAGEDPEALGHKSLAVNLSDLAAMGAKPAWVTLSLTLPAADEAWLEGFCRGFFALAKVFHVELVGGDITRGPLNITLQVHGTMPAGTAMRRSGARVGDLVYVTGTLGDAALALLVQQHGYQPAPGFADFLGGRLARPVPRVLEGIRLRSLVRAAIDVSDGLVSDLGHMLKASGVGASINVASLPRSAALDAYVDDTGDAHLALNGGDDYELCFTIASEKQGELEKLATGLDCRCTWIGLIEQSPGLRCLQEDGSQVEMPCGGYDHFARG